VVQIVAARQAHDLARRVKIKSHDQIAAGAREVLGVLVDALGGIVGVLGLRACVAQQVGATAVGVIRQAQQVIG
jgi:hypothetical protein